MLGSIPVTTREEPLRQRDDTRRGAAPLVVMGEAIARYGFPDGHPFGADRHGAFAREFDARGLAERVTVKAPACASTDDLLLFHTREYVEFVRERSEKGQGFLDGGDTPAFRGVFDAASAVVGSSLLAMEAIVSGESARAFVPIAGLHHAARDRAAGFCVFNDIGVVVEALRARHGLRRIAYVDIDAHHGDGVFYAFEDDADLIFADVHEDGSTLYPGTGKASEVGRGKGQGTKLNIPVPAGADDAVFDQVWPKVMDLMAREQPEFVILQCGADSVAGDPITHMQFSAAVHAKAARDLRAFTEEQGHGRLLALGGGGYHRGNIAAAWNGVVEALI